MKKQISAVLFLILFSLSSAPAQTVEQQVAQIRNLFASTNRRIDDGLKDNTQGFHYASCTIGGERDGQQWAAVGTMKRADEFWFDGEPGAGEDGKTSDAGKMIRKIVSTYTGAADLRSRSEYLFDASGALIFAFTTELAADNTIIERRFYYAKGKLIRIARDGKNIDRSFGNEDTQLAAGAQANAKRRQSIFALIFAE